MQKVKTIKKAIYLFLTAIVIYYKKFLISRSEHKIGKLEFRLTSEKQVYKNLLKETKTYCNSVLKTERNI
ncbi:hypothetical protein [Clostridium sp. VAP52]|uniref:hypothetical protein n=1 Tax=Clostridium sp. VAP52 TaxID=2949977 RepID=UPI0020796337|nr:hypothetical protein [Clostridium sp. VAP52]